jgi:hypothetical protein
MVKSRIIMRVRFNGEIRTLESTLLDESDVNLHREKLLDGNLLQISITQSKINILNIPNNKTM